jgi:hypothetical protein
MHINQGFMPCKEFRLVILLSIGSVLHKKYYAINQILLLKLPTCPGIFIVQVVCLNLEDGTDRLSRNVGNLLLI